MESNILDAFTEELLFCGFLIPFYIFAYEKDLKKIANDKKRLAALKKEYLCIREQLDFLCENSNISEYTKQTIVKMTENVVNSLARNYEAIQKGVTDSMGGKILEYEAKDILNCGKKEGRAEGMEEKTKTIIHNMLKRNMPDADICALAECSQELVDEVRRNMK